jgi:hypothetical protein
MDNKEGSLSMGTVIAIGFIVLGIINLFALRNYHRTTFTTTKILPGLLFIAIGLTILIIRSVRRNKQE